MREYLNAFELYTLKLIIKNQNLVLYSFLSKELTKNVKDKREKERIQKRLHKTVNRLVEKNIIESIRINERERLLKVADPMRTLDLKMLSHARNPYEDTLMLKIEKINEVLEENKHLKALLPQHPRQHTEFFRVTRAYYLRSFDKITKEDLREITASFERYILDISDKILLFRDDENNYFYMRYKSRFTNVKEAMRRYEKLKAIVESASQQYDEAVFLTITIPPCFPPKVAMWILRFIFHRIKALCRKIYNKTIPHLCVIEPQNNLNPHLHAILFNIPYIMPKKQLTIYLRNKLIAFLEKMGDHYKTTINRRADDKTIEALNRYGKKLLKRFLKYEKKLISRRSKKKREGYTGLINWITKIKKDNDNNFVFENEPPDSRDKQKPTQHDGGLMRVVDYVAFYSSYAVSQAIKTTKDPYRKQPKELAFYFFMRLSFYTYTKSLYKSKRKEFTSGFEFVGAFRLDDVQDLINF